MACPQRSRRRSELPSRSGRLSFRRPLRRPAQRAAGLGASVGSHGRPCAFAGGSGRHPGAPLRRGPLADRGAAGCGRHVREPQRAQGEAALVADQSPFLPRRSHRSDALPACLRALAAFPVQSWRPVALAGRRPDDGCARGDERRRARGPGRGAAGQSHVPADDVDDLCGCQDAT